MTVLHLELADAEARLLQACAAAEGMTVERWLQRMASEASVPRTGKGAVVARGGGED